MGSGVSSILSSIGGGLQNLIGPATPQSPTQQIAGALGSSPSLAGITPGMVMGLGPGSPPLPTAQPGILRGMGSLGSSALGTLPTLEAGKQLMAPTSAPPTPPQAQPMRAPQPMAPNTPVGPAQTGSPMSSLMKYQQFLRGMG